MMKSLLEQFVAKNAVTHLDCMKKHTDFPESCSLSSEFIASYLKSQYPEEEIELIYGTFGKQDFFHSWVEYRNQILDFTMFQFLTKKEQNAFYANMKGKELLSYIQSLQGVVIFDKEYPLYKTLFKRYASIKPELVGFAGAGVSYSKYIKKIKKSEILERYFSSIPFLITGEEHDDYLETQGKQKKYNRNLRAWVVK